MPIPRPASVILFAVAGAALGTLAGVVACGTGNQPAAPALTPPAQQQAMASDIPLLPAATQELPRSKGVFAAAPTWIQDFTTMQNGPVDETVWRHETDANVPSYNEEAQAYKKENVFIKDGRLVIQARPERYTYPNDPEHRVFAYTSGRIDTKQSFSFEYGKFEAVIKLPKGKGTWPAFWFLSASQPHTARLHPTAADWDQHRFYMHDGELDAMEMYGQLPGVIEGTLYTFNKTYEGSVTVPDASDTFHAYGVEVTPAKVIWTLDGKPFYSVTKPSSSADDWPFGNGNRFYPIFNLALGGTGGGAIDTAMHQHWVMEVRKAAYYPYTGN